MTHISWIATSLLLSLLVGLTICCRRLSDGNWMTKMGDIRNEDGYWGERSQGQMLSQLADLSNSRRVRNRRNQGASAEPDYDSVDSSYSSVQDFVDENAINPELFEGLFPSDPAYEKEQRRRHEEEMFRNMDANNDGRVTKDELLANPSLGPSDIEPMLQSKDNNSDGIITFAEFMGVQEIFIPNIEVPVEPRQKIQRPEIKNNRECTQQLMEVCDAQFINSTKSARENASHENICSIFQVYIDCLARESTRCRAEEFTGQTLSIASGLRHEGACPGLRLTSVLYPDLVNLNAGVRDHQDWSPGRAYPRQEERPKRPSVVDITAAEPSLSMYGSGGKQEDYRYGQRFEVFDDIMLADEDIGTESSSSSAFVDDSKVAKSNHERKNIHNTDRDSTRTRDRTGSRDNWNVYDVTTPLVEELSPLPQYEIADVREHSKSDNIQTVTSSWRYTTPRHHPRHHHTSSQTQSTEHLQARHIRQARSTTTKKSHFQRSRSRSRSNCSVATIWPCNQAFVLALAEGEENPCESLVRFRHCVHKSTRHCVDTNVFKIREGLKYLSKEHRRAKLCRQIAL